MELCDFLREECDLRKAGDTWTQGSWFGIENDSIDHIHGVHSFNFQNPEDPEDSEAEDRPELWIFLHRDLIPLLESAAASLPQRSVAGRCGERS